MTEEDGSPTAERTFQHMLHTGQKQTTAVTRFTHSQKPTECVSDVWSVELEGSTKLKSEVHAAHLK